jgi:hypothetical protein
MKALTAIALVLCLAAAAKATPGSDVQVLAAHKGWIDNSAPRVPAQFGVNGTRLMWHDLTPFTGGKLRTLDAAAPTTSVTGRWPAGIAFAGGRTASRGEEGGLSRTNSLGVWDQHGRHRGLEHFDTPDGGAGGYLTDPYAAGPNIAYGWYETRVVKGSCDADGFDCEYAIRRGGLRLIDGLRRGRLVTRAPVAALTLSSAGTAAYVRATPRWHDGRDSSVPGGPSIVEVITLSSPRVLQRLRVPGRVTELALSDRIVAVNTHRARSRPATVFFDLWTGRRLRALRSPSGYAFPSLALKGSGAVLLLGKELTQLEAYSGSKRVLTTLRGDGGGVAFAGDKLVWYEQRGRDTKARYRILALSLTRP